MHGVPRDAHAETAADGRTNHRGLSTRGLLRSCAQQNRQSGPRERDIAGEHPARERVVARKRPERARDGVAHRGKRKLAEAWADRRPSPSSATGSKLQGPVDDKEVSDE